VVPASAAEVAVDEEGLHGDADAIWHSDKSCKTEEVNFMITVMTVWMLRNEKTRRQDPRGNRETRQLSQFPKTQN
jgi:hypothetical protein